MTRAKASTNALPADSGDITEAQEAAALRHAAAHRREVDAVIAGMLADAAAPVEDDGVRVLVGDAAEDAATYADRRAELAHAYGVVTPLEEMLVDRVAALAWRLNRLQRVERGAVAVRTESAAQAEHRRREHDAIRQRTENVARGRAAAEDDNPEVIRHALGELRSLTDLLLPNFRAARAKVGSGRSGHRPAMAGVGGGLPADKGSAGRPLQSLWDAGPDNRFKGRGEMISVIAYNLHTGLTDDRHADAAVVRRAAPQMRAYLAS